MRATLVAHVPVRARADALRAIAVAGTPTQCAAIDLGLERYDPARIEGHVLTARRACASCWTGWPRSRSPSGAQIRGLDPARAPVIVAGIAILLEVLSRFGLDHVEASERDILVGLALSTTSRELMSTVQIVRPWTSVRLPCAIDLRWRIRLSEGRSCLPPPSTDT